MSNPPLSRVLFLVFMIISSFSSSIALAQESILDNVDIDVLAGINYNFPLQSNDSLNGTSYNLDSTQLYYNGYKVQPGIFLGGQVRYPFTEAINFISGLAFQLYRYKDVEYIHYTHPTHQVDQKLTINRHISLGYLELPLKIEYKLYSFLVIQGGLNLHFRLLAKEKMTDHYQEIINEEEVAEKTIYEEDTRRIGKSMKGTALGFDLGIRVPYKNWSLHLGGKYLPNLNNKDNPTPLSFLQISGGLSYQIFNVKN
jgi:hypothetical protein